MRRAQSVTLLALVAVLSGLQIVLARFEDQAGAYDWYRQHVGLVSSAVFHPSKPRVCVATEQSVVGCLNLRDGSIAWRKLLGGGSAASSMNLIVHSNTLLTAASGHLRSFDLDGNLKWQRSLQKSSSQTVLMEVPRTAESKDKGSVIVLQGGVVQVLDGADGSEIVGQQGQPELDKDNLQTVAGTKSSYLVAYNTGSTQVTVAAVSEAGAGPITTHVADSPSGLSAMAAGAAESFAALSSDGSSICVLPLGESSTPKFTCQAVKGLAPDMPAVRASKIISTSSGYVLISADAGAPGAAVLSVGSDGRLSLLQYHPNAAGASAEVETEEGPVVGLLELPGADRMRLVIVSSKTGHVVQQEEFPAAPATQRIAGQAPALVPTNVVLAAFRKKDKTTGFRALASFSSGVTVLLQQSVVVWSADESLATIKETLFVDLPANSANGTALQSADAAKADMNTRIRYQVLGAKVQLKINTPAEAEEVLQLRDLLSDKNMPVRDVNGFRKLLLALTTTGKLVALHNGDGRVLWSRFFPADSVPTRLLPWRSYHDITHSPEVLVLREAQPGAYAAVLNAHTGEQLWQQPLPHGVREVVPVPSPMHEGSAVQSLYLLMDAATDGGAPPISLLPDTPAAHTHFRSSQRSPYIVLPGPEPGTLQGYSVSPSTDSMPISQAWQIALPDAILAVASRDPTEPIQSSVKVLSDRTIKYKYLNPNLLFVATGLPNGAPLDSSDNTGSLSAEVTAHLIDTVTGRVLHRQSHVGARGPVTAVMVENAVLYFFRDIESGRYIACSMELYDATPGREFSVLDYLFNPNSTQPVSSFTPTPIEVLTQSFFSRLVPTGLAVTRTEQGITAKQLLLITNTEQVYALDRRFVDPRRPKKQKLSQDEIEEGLMPYQDTLPLVPQSFVTLDKQVLGLRGVSVEPTRLESTCLMFVHGVDLFFTRLAPAKGFDSLEDDFNYALLVAALVGLTVGSVMLNYMAKQTSLGQKWK